MYRPRPPSKIIDAQFYEQEEIIQSLQEENKRLKDENAKLVSENIQLIDRCSIRTLHMALNGALPKPGTPECKALGYDSPAPDPK